MITIILTILVFAYPWPMRPFDSAHQVSATLGDARGDSVNPRFHRGIDIPANLGTSVFSIASGIAYCGGIGFNTYVRVGNFCYVHIDTLISTGDSILGIIDTVNTPPDTIGTVLEYPGGAHLHFQVGPAGGPYYNPLSHDGGPVGYEDGGSPVIHSVDYWVNGSEGGVAQQLQNVLYKKVDIRAFCQDTQTSGGVNNTSGIYKLGWQVTDITGNDTFGVEQTIVFPQVQPPNNGDSVLLIYDRHNYRTSSPFYYWVTNSIFDNQVRNRYWNTRQKLGEPDSVDALTNFEARFPDGKVIVDVIAADIRGNADTMSDTVTIDNFPPFLKELKIYRIREKGLLSDTILIHDDTTQAAFCDSPTVTFRGPSEVGSPFIFVLRFSETMKDTDAFHVRVKNLATGQLINVNPSQGWQSTLFTNDTWIGYLSIPPADTPHFRGYNRLIVDAFDVAGNRLDSDLSDDYPYKDEWGQWHNYQPGDDTIHVFKIGSYQFQLPGPIANVSPVIGNIREDPIGPDLNEFVVACYYSPEGKEISVEEPQVGERQYHGKVFAFDAYGNQVFEKNYGVKVTTSPMLKDIDGDGFDEVIVAYYQGISVLDADGQEIWWDNTRYVTSPGGYDVIANVGYSSPCIADVDEDGEPEILVGTDIGNIYAWNAEDGSVPPNATPGRNRYAFAGENFNYWEAYDQTKILWCAPNVGDIDGDGHPEVIAGVYGSSHELWAWHNWDNDEYFGVDRVSGFPVVLHGRIFSSPVLGDMDGDGVLDIVVGDDAGYVYAINGWGEILWERFTGDKVKNAPSLVDLDRDGALEVLAGSYSDSVFVLRSDGTDYPGFPVYAGAWVKTSVIVGDIDGQPGLEIAAGTVEGKVRVWDSSGNEITYLSDLFSLPASIHLNTPCLGDLDRDGYNEIIFGDEEGHLSLFYTGGMIVNEDTSGEIYSTKVWKRFKGTPDGKGLGISVYQIGPLFIRGDVNADGDVALSDLVFLANYLFAGGSEPPCFKAADLNDSGTLEVADLAYLANFLLSGGSEPPAPYPACGTDPTADELGCVSFPPCGGKRAPLTVDVTSGNSQKRPRNGVTDHICPVKVARERSQPASPGMKRTKR